MREEGRDRLCLLGVVLDKGGDGIGFMMLLLRVFDSLNLLTTFSAGGG